MKKIFYILLVILGMLVSIYLMKNHDEVLNYEYHDNNIDIFYPSFGSNWIDDMVVNYVNQKLDYFKYRNMEELFIDYDYHIEDSILDLFFYNYEYQDNMNRVETTNFCIDLDKKEIISFKEKETSLEYDIYMGRLIDKEKPMIAFTFDDGPSHNTSKIIDILNKYHVKATFFLLGRNIENNKDIVNSLKENGMEIGNHSYSHKLLTRLSESQVKEEFTKTTQLIYDAIGSYPALTRPSYGSVNKKVKKTVDTPIILWDIDTLDWKYHNSKYITNKILKKVKDGDIILMHDIYTATANALDKVIPELLDKGYQLVTVSELFYYKNIELEKGHVYRYAR